MKMKKDEGRKTHRIIGCLALALIGAGVLTFNFDALYLAGVFFGLGIVFGVVFVKLYWDWFRKSGKARGFFGKLLGLLFRGLGKAVSVFKPIGRRLGSIARKILPKNPLRLKFFKDEKESLFGKRTGRRISPYKRMKWKNIDNDTDRVRYVYYTFMAKRIRRGFRYKPSHTPKEVCVLMCEASKQDAFNEVELFDMYNVYRYKLVEADGNEKAEGLKRFV